MSAGSADTTPPREASSARGWAGFERSWLEGFTSSYLSPQEGRPDTGRQVLVVWQRQGSDALPPIHQMLALDARDLPALVESGEDCLWASRRAPTVRLLFKNERATPVVLEFLEKTMVGKMPGLALLGVEEEEEDLEEIEMWLDEEDEPGGEGE